MRQSGIRAVLIAALALVSAGGVAAADLASVFDSFYTVGLEGDPIAVQDVVLVRPDATFTLQSGRFYPAAPLEGVVTGGVFVGEGEVLFRPSQAMDRRILNTRMQEWLDRPGDEYRGKFRRMVLRFDDGTLEELGGASGAGDAAEQSSASKAWKDRNKRLENIQGLGPLNVVSLNLEMDFLERVLNGLDGREFFLAEFDAGEEDGWLTYIHNDSWTHEVFFGQHKSLGALADVRPFNVHSVKEDHDDAGNYIADPEDDSKLLLDTDHYRIAVNIPDTRAVRLESVVEFTPRVPLRTVRFDLVNNVRASWKDRSQAVKVQSVTDGDGTELPFLHRRHQILVEYPESLPVGEDATMALTAEEEIIVQITPESYSLLNTFPWFPQSGFVGGRNTHEWTVRIKKGLTAVVSGKLVREWEEDGLNCTGWVMDEEVQFPSIIFGKFQVETDTYRSELTGEEVSLRVYATPSSGDLAGFVTPDGLRLDGVSLDGLKKMKPVLEEAKQILGFMEDLFGPYPYDYLNIAQMAPFMGFGQAPPGLVQLTGDAFLSTATLSALVGSDSRVKLDYFHEFFAHEIAHQWWAHVVWGDSFRDAWLSESFAEYASGLYVLELQGPARFQAKMKEWKQAAQTAEGAAPLAALSTLGGDNGGSYYQNLIYFKGPYVIHMLRAQMGHDEWVQAMQNFFGKYRHMNLRTEALVAELEQVAGYQLDFFFDQWWKGTGIPKFDFSYQVEPTEDGRYLFIGTIKQEGIPFKVMMPVFFHFAKDRVHVEKRPVLKAVDVYQVYLPEEPKRVTLDDYNTLLAVIKQ